MDDLIMEPPPTPEVTMVDESEDWKDLANFNRMGSGAASVASSQASSIRHRRLPPPPPSGEWSGMGRGKRANEDDDEPSGIGKRLNVDIDEISLVSKITGDTGPKQNHRLLDQQRKGLHHIPSTRHDYAVTYDTLLLGRNIDVYQHKIYVDTTFCSRNVLERLMGLKYEVKRCGQTEFGDLQSKLKVVDMYHFPSAVILANIDALYKNSFTHPKSHPSGESLVGPDELLYVVDLQGGPGAWVEYILSKRKWEAKVFGFSSTQEGLNYELPESGHFPRESFEQWKGFDGIRGNGNISRPEFVNKFAGYVRRCTGGKGAHIVLANGSLDNESIDEDKKELHIKQIALAEVLIAMKTLREGGNFILKLYDMFTPYTVGLVYLVYRVFERIAILRPESERPASSGRYVVCQGFRQGNLTKDVVNYLTNCHQTEFQSSLNYKYATEAQAEIVDLIPMEALRSSTGFYDYVYNANIEIGERQLFETGEIIKKIKNADDYVRKYRQDISYKCINVWGVGKHTLQVKHKDLDVINYVKCLLRPYSDTDMARAERDGESELTYDKLQELTKPVEWHFVHVGRDRGLYVSRGGENVFKYVGGDWKTVSDDMDLANNTLVYADIVDEISQYEGKQIVMTAMHIIDGLFLGGKDIRMLPYTERLDYCAKFAASMHKPMRENVIYVRAKKAKELTHIADSFREVHRRQVLGRGDRKKKPLVPVHVPQQREGANNPHYALTGYLIFRTMRENSASTDFLQSLNTRLFFPITDTMNLDPSGEVMNLSENVKAAIDAATLADRVKKLAV